MPITTRPALGRSIVLGVIAAVACSLASVPDASADDTPVHVSDQFKKVSRKVAEKFVESRLDEACADGDMLCQAITRDLATAFGAALSDDDARLEASLNRFFVDSSVAGLLSGNIGEVSRLDLPEGLRPLLRCLASIAVSENACAVEKKHRDSAVAALKQCEGCDSAELVASKIGRGKTPTPGESARAIAEILMTAPIDRPDLAIYLDDLATFFDQGIEAGLFPAASAYVSAATVSEPEQRLMNRDLAYSLLDPDRDPFLKSAIEGCGARTDGNRKRPADPSAFDTWVAGRTEFVDALRASLLDGRAMNASSLDSLTRYKCASGQGTEIQRSTVEALRRHARFLLAPVRSSQAIREYAVPGLAIAAVLDQLRAPDDERFANAILEVLAFGIAQEVARERMAALSHSPADSELLRTVDILRPVDLLTTCELAALRSAGGLSIVAAADASAGQCYSLASERNQSLNLTSAVDLGPAPDAAEVVWRSVADLVLSEEAKHWGGNAPGYLGDFLAALQTSANTPILDAIESIAASPADSETRKRLRVLTIDLVHRTPASNSGLPIKSAQAFGRLLAGNATLADSKPGPAPADPAAATALAKRIRAEAVRVRREPPHRWQVSKGSEAVIHQAEVRLLAVIEKASRDLAPAEVPEGIDVELLSRALRHLVAGDQRLAERILVRAGTEFLIERMEQLTNRLLKDDFGTCEDNMRARSILIPMDAGCAAHVLIRGAYGPIADRIWSDGITAESVSEVSADTYRSLRSIADFDYSPIILNVGLGGSYVTDRRWFETARADKNAPERFAALTVLDKVGLAVWKYSGNYGTFETGPFVGGFLDSVAREATKDDRKRYWLFGATAGLAKGRKTDLGLELHVGWAAPYTLDHDPQLLIGGAVVVPFSALLDD